MFARYDSLEAQVGAALAGWPSGSLARLQALASDNPRSALVRFYLGLAQFWEGRDRGGERLVRARRSASQPDTFYAVRADGLLHPRFAPLLPPFTPSFAAAARGRAPAGRRASSRRCGRGAAGEPAHAPPVRRRAAAARQPALGGAAVPARGAAGAGRPGGADGGSGRAASRSRDPSKAFSQLGPLAKRFPKAATVRFHLGLMLLWMAK